MKKLYTFIIVFISVLGLAMLSNSCADLPDVIEELDLADVLTPTSVTASIDYTDGRTTTIAWNNSNTATQYVLELYRWASEGGSSPDSADDVTDAMLESMSPYLQETVPQVSSGSQTSYVVVLPEDYDYYIRVKGQNPGNQGDSKWAHYEKMLTPYLVMDPVEDYKASVREARSITLEWTLPEGDTDGINRILVSPNPDGGSADKVYTVSSMATEVTVDGLTPSTMYTLSANYGSSPRGVITAWTRPDADASAITVSDSTYFVQTILDWKYATDGPLTIMVEYNDGEVYDLPSIPVLGELTLIGVETAAGDKPVLQTNVSLYPAGSTYTLKKDEETLGEITDVPGATKLRLEGLTFDGNNGATNNGITAADDFTNQTAEVTVEVVNCNFQNFKCGVIYDNTKNEKYASILLDGVYVSDTTGDGGDFMDFRGSTISNFTIQNCTFTDGSRAFLRIDAACALGNLVITNNTINNVCTFDNSNNKGILYVRADATGDYILSNNLFLNNNAVDDKTLLISQTGFKLPTASNNWYYNNNPCFCYEKFDDGDNGSAATKDFTWSDAIAGGGARLDTDPCYDSSRGNFYISDQSVSEAKVGDPRWFADYIAQPDPALVPVEYGYTWDLTDSKTFYSKIDQTCTRGNTRFIVTDKYITVDENGFTFSEAADVMSSSPLPTDGAIAFIVDGPGSVVISTATANTSALNVSWGVYDESIVGTTTAYIAGSVSGGASKTQVALSDLTEGNVYMIYIYPVGGSITMNQLVWSEDISGGGANLSAPSNLVLSAESAANNENVTLTWDAVANAASYVVNTVGYNGVDTKTTVSSNSYTISGLDAGYYNFYVKAVPADSDTVREESEWSDEEVLFFSTGAPLEAVNAYATTTWGDETFAYVLDAVAGGSTAYEISETFVYDGLQFVGGSGYKILNDDANMEGQTVHALTLGGGGKSYADGANRNLSFKIPGDGTLTVELESSGGSERYLNVFLDGVEYTASTDYDSTNGGYPAPEKGSPTSHDIVISGASDGSMVELFSKSSGMNIISVTWTPGTAGEFPETPEGCVPTYEVTEWASSEFEWLLTNIAGGDTSNAYKDSDFDTEDGLLHFIQGGGSGFKFASGNLDAETTGYRFQFGGSGSTTKCCVTFNVSTAGTLKFTIISGSSDTTRYLNVTVGETEYKGETEGFTAEASSGTYPTEYSFDVDSVSESTPIYLYSAGSGINVFGIKWVPTGVTE